MHRICDGCETVAHCMNHGCIPKQSIQNHEPLVYRLRKRAEIRRQIPERKSVQEGKPDRIADILEEAANEIERLREYESMYNELWEDDLK